MRNTIPAPAIEIDEEEAVFLIRRMREEASRLLARADSLERALKRSRMTPSELEQEDAEQKKTP